MKVGENLFEKNKSSFLSIEKNMAFIVKKMMENQRLMKLLYYSEKDCLGRTNLTEEQMYSMIGHQISIVPRVLIESECPTICIITVDDFTPNYSNPEFRDCTINFQILCHADHWNLGDFQLRPYKIAGEIDHMFNNKKMVGIGTTAFIGSSNLVLNDELMGVQISYKAIHSVEDEIE